MPEQGGSQSRKQADLDLVAEEIKAKNGIMAIASHVVKLG
jgi:hypothetical protein